MDFDSLRAFKRPHSTVPMAASNTSSTLPSGQPAWFVEVWESFKESIAKEIEPLRVEFQNVKITVDDHEKRLKLLEERAPSPARSAISSPSSSVAGSSISTAATMSHRKAVDNGGMLKIRGFCEFGPHAKDGVDRPQAEELVGELKEHIPSTLRAMCGPIQLRDVKNFEVRVPITSAAYVEEICRWMNQVLKEDLAWQYNQRTLYVVPEREESERPKYALMGKLKEGLHAARQALVPEPSWHFREFWAPHWKIMVVGPNKEEEEMLSIKEGKAVWREEAMNKFLGKELKDFNI